MSQTGRGFFQEYHVIFFKRNGNSNTGKYWYYWVPGVSQTRKEINQNRILVNFPKKCR